MATTFDRLVEAGAPKIEEPLFYRIAEPEDGLVLVQLRRSRSKFGSDTLASRAVPLSRLAPGAVLAAVVAACVEVVAEARTIESARQLAGDFPADVAA